MTNPNRTSASVTVIISESIRFSDRSLSLMTDEMNCRTGVESASASVELDHAQSITYVVFTFITDLPRRIWKIAFEDSAYETVLMHLEVNTITDVNLGVPTGIS